MGYGDTELGAKYRFVQQTDCIPEIGTFPLLELPTADQSRGLGDAHPQLYLPIWMQKDFGKWTTYGGGGYWINPGTYNQNWWYMGWYVGWLVQRQITDRFALGTEVFHETAQVRFGESATASASCNLSLHVNETGSELSVLGSRPCFRLSSGWRQEQPRKRKIITRIGTGTPMSQRSGKETPPIRLLRFLASVNDSFMIVFSVRLVYLALQYHCSFSAITSE